MCAIMSVTISAEVLTLLNLVVCAVLAVSSFAWVPLAVLAHRLFQLCVYDDDHVIRGSRWSPLLLALNRIAMLGVGRVQGYRR